MIKCVFKTVLNEQGEPIKLEDGSYKTVATFNAEEISYLIANKTARVVVKGGSCLNPKATTEDGKDFYRPLGGQELKDLIKTNQDKVLYVNFTNQDNLNLDQLFEIA